MKSQVILHVSLLQDAGDHFNHPVKRDLETLCRRSSAEGPRFLDTKIAELDDALLRGIEVGSLPDIPGWAKSNHRQYPKFLSFLWERVFAADGSLLPLPSTEAVLFLRQITRASKKIFAVCDDAYIPAAIDAFVDTDRALSSVVFPSWSGALQDVCKVLFGRVIGRAVTTLDSFKHGPGAVAERKDNVSKFDFDIIPDHLVDQFGYETFRPFHTDDREVKSGCIPARLIAVPKTATKPRLISIEPSYNQYLQQALKGSLYSGLSRHWSFQIDDQTPNKELARLGSIDGSFATVDLSEASDRVHMGLVRLLFGYNRTFMGYLEATRSREVDVPGHGLLALNKFASMGSALTFPIECIVFATIAIFSICEQDRDFSPTHIKDVARKRVVRVYGDDIIVPTEYYRVLSSNLTRLGLKVNEQKSFYGTGHAMFRESCGGDYFMGTDVTPAYCRVNLDEPLLRGDRLPSVVSLRNHLYFRHLYPRTVKFLDRLIDGLGAHVPMGPVLPVVPSEGRKAVGDTFRYDPSFKGESRWNSSLQRREYLAHIPVSGTKGSEKEDWARLHSSLSKNYTWNLPPNGKLATLKLRRRWVAAW